jgi:hypothetical protein
VAVIGRRMPRLYTEPLRALTAATSAGFGLIEFAKKLDRPLLPWQEEAAIRALELNADGSFRFKTVLILVGRQSGKTHLLKLLAFWRMWVDEARLVLGAAQSLDIAKEAWSGTVELAEELLPMVVEKVRYANGEQCLTLTNGARYRISATTRGAGRGLSVDLLVLDEIREQRDWASWAALSKTVMARPRGQIICISNAGDDESVVLNSLRDAALAGRDPTLGLFEWSAPEGCALDDPEMWSYSVPALGHTITEAAIRSSMATDPPNVFRTEVLCQHVSSLSAALDQSGWAAGADPAGSIAPHRKNLAAGLDVSLDGGHVSLVAAAPIGGGKYRVEPIAAWASLAEAQTALPGLLERLKPVGLAWFPSGPANALAPFLKALPYARELTGSDVTAACMGLADAVRAGLVMHNAAAVLDSQVATVGKTGQGDLFRFTRRGGGSCSAVYALAGALHLARVADSKPRRAAVFVL